MHWLISALVPIKVESGAMCGYVDVDLSMTEIKAMEREDGKRGVLELPGMDTRDVIGHLYCSIRQMESDIYTYIDDPAVITAEK